LALETGLGTAIETRNGASKTTSKIDDKNQIEEQFISSYAFHRTTGGRVRETPVGEHLELENLELFDAVAQDKTSFVLQQSTSNQKMKLMNNTMKGRNCRTKSEGLLLN
jgi:hypothetical protein